MPTEPQTPVPARRRPGLGAMLLTGVLAVTVFAATDAVLRLVADEAAPVGGASAAAGATSAGGGAAAGGTPTQAGPVPPAPGGAGLPAPGGAAPPGAPPPAGAPPAPGNAPPTRDPAANPADDGDTNVEEEPEGPRRAPPPTTSDEESPEFRESADNNITLPVDI